MRRNTDTRGEGKMRMDEIAREFLDLVDHEAAWGTEQEHGIVRTIEPDQVEPIVEQVMALVAEIHAAIIDVGSEREAILECEALREGLVEAFKGWEMGPA